MSISLSLHAALLLVYLQPERATLSADRHFVDFVSRNLKGFEPEQHISRDVERIIHKGSPVKAILARLSSPSKLLPLPAKTQQSLDPAPSDLIFDNRAQSKIDGTSNINESESQVTTALIVRSESIDVIPNEPSGTQNIARSEVAVAAPTAWFKRALPRYAVNPLPVYPELARRKGWTGEVRLLVEVDETGRVRNLRVTDSSGHSVLDRAARRSVGRWRFIPATEGGLRVTSEVIVPVDFQLPVSSS